MQDANDKSDAGRAPASAAAAASSADAAAKRRSAAATTVRVKVEQIDAISFEAELEDALPSSASKGLCTGRGSSNSPFIFIDTDDDDDVDDDDDDSVVEVDDVVLVEPVVSSALKESISTSTDDRSSATGTAASSSESFFAPRHVAPIPDGTSKGPAVEAAGTRVSSSSEGTKVDSRPNEGEKGGATRIEKARVETAPARQPTARPCAASQEAHPATNADRPARRDSAPKEAGAPVSVSTSLGRNPAPPEKSSTPTADQDETAPPEDDASEATLSNDNDDTDGDTDGDTNGDTNGDTDAGSRGEGGLPSTTAPVASVAFAATRAAVASEPRRGGRDGSEAGRTVAAPLFFAGPAPAATTTTTATHPGPAGDRGDTAAAARPEVPTSAGPLPFGRIVSRKKKDGVHPPAAPPLHAATAHASTTSSGFGPRKSKDAVLALAGAARSGPSSLLKKHSIKSRNSVAASAEAAKPRKRKLPSNPAQGSVAKRDRERASKKSRGSSVASKRPADSAVPRQGGTALKKPPPTAAASKKPPATAAASRKPPPPPAAALKKPPSAAMASTNASSPGDGSLRGAPVIVLDSSCQVDELAVGQRVYAKWEENAQWYFGTVLKRVVKYVVQFEDGDVSQRALDRSDVYAEGEIEIRESNGTETQVRKRQAVQPNRAARQLDEDIEFVLETDSFGLVDFDEVSNPNGYQDQYPGESHGAIPTRITSGDIRSHGSASRNGELVNGERRSGKRITDGLVQGARVFAFCPPTFRWFWGKIFSVKGEGDDRRFEVSFDENAQYATLKVCDVYSEEEYRSLAPLSLEELSKRACMECSFCRKVDCGRCKSCRANKRAVSQKERKVCLFKFCLMIPDDMKAQHLPGYTPTARFVVTDPSRLKAGVRSNAPLHPDLAGLQIMTASKYYRGVETHIRSLKDVGELRQHEVDEIVADIYHDLFDIDKVEEVKEHELLQTRWLREWVDGSLARRTLMGTVAACYRPFGSRNSVQCSFKIDFDDLSVVRLNQGLELFDLKVPQSEVMTEQHAWSGCVAAGIVPRRALRDDPQVQLQWVAPDCITDALHDGMPCRTVKAMGHAFRVQVKPSKIPGAGLGAFVTALAPSGPNSPRVSTFRLEPGVLIDFGVYAPLRRGNCKLNSVAMVKDFVTGGKCDMYSWECGTKDGRAFDITNDRTGELLEEARRSVLTYVNEISHPDREQPSMEVQHDPSGAIHYLLGHVEPDRVDLCLNYDEEVELTVDYGQRYEKIRVRKQYPRVSGAALAELEGEIASEPYEILREILKWDHVNVIACIKFFFSICLQDGDNPEGGEPDPSLLPAEYRERFFAAVLLLHTRMKAIVAAPSASVHPGGSGHGAGTSAGDGAGAVDRSKKLLSAILRRPVSLTCQALLANDLSRLAIRLALGEADEASLDELTPMDLGWRLANLL